MIIDIPDKTFKQVNLKTEIPLLECETSDDGIRFYETPEGLWYPSITTLLSQLSKEGLEKWAARVGKEVAEKEKKKGARRGTGLHEIAEQYLLNNFEDVQRRLKADAGHRLLFNAVKGYLNEIDYVAATEISLWSDRFGLAGTCDCIADFRGKPCIIDFKTAKYLRKKEWIDNYFMQATFYSYAFQERTGIKVPNLAIIFAHDNGTSAVFEEHRDNWVKKLEQVNTKYREQLFEGFREDDKKIKESV
jgi:genome maintenance exonuclease 1